MGKMITRAVRTYKAKFETNDAIEHIPNIMEERGWLVLSCRIDSYRDIETLEDINLLSMRCLYLGKRKVLDKELTDELKNKFKGFKKYKSTWTVISYSK